MNLAIDVTNILLWLGNIILDASKNKCYTYKLTKLILACFVLIDMHPKKALLRSRTFDCSKLSTFKLGVLMIESLKWKVRDMNQDVVMLPYNESHAQEPISYN